MKENKTVSSENIDSGWDLPASQAETAPTKPETLVDGKGESLPADHSAAVEECSTLYQQVGKLMRDIAAYEDALATHQKEFGADAGHAVYIDEFESKIAAAKMRQQEIYARIDSIDAKFPGAADEGI